MGTRLRDWKKQTPKELADGKSPHGKGRLTDEVIDKLQIYYGMAIRGNLPEAIHHHSIQPYLPLAWAQDRKAYEERREEAK